MKRINFLLLAIMTAFSSIIYGADTSPYSVSEKVGFMTGMKYSLAIRCVSDYNQKAAQNNHTISDEEREDLAKNCVCAADKTIEQLGGYSFLFENRYNTELIRTETEDKVLDIKNAIKKDCIPKRKPNFND